MAHVLAVSTSRWRRILLALYLLAAFADAAGKAMAANPAISRALSRALHPADSRRAEAG